MADKTKTTDVTPAPEPEMSLEQAGASFRALLNTFRGMVVMGAAVETALTAKHQLASIEAAKALAVSASEAAAKTREGVENQLAERRGQLAAVDAQIKTARGALTDLNSEVTAERARWNSERVTQDAKHRAALAEQDRELLAAQARVEEAKKKLADLVAPYARPVSVEA